MDVEAAPAIALYRRRSHIVRLAAAKVHVATLYPGTTADGGKDSLPRGISTPAHRIIGCPCFIEGHGGVAHPSNLSPSAANIAMGSVTTLGEMAAAIEAVVPGCEDQD